MNLSLSDQNMHPPCKGGPEEEKPELLHPCFRRSMYDDSLATYSNDSIISQLLRKTIQNKRALDEGLFYLPAAALSSSSVADSSQEDHNSTSSKNSAVEPASPGSQSSPEGERPVSEHHRAKRARVENIIRGMAGSPNARLSSDGERGEEDAREARDFYRENKRKQRVPQHQEHGLSEGASAGRGSVGGSRDEECQRLRDQLRAMQRLLRQLQEKFVQVHSLSDSEQDDREEAGSACATEHDDVTGDREPQEGSESEPHTEPDREVGRRPDGTKMYRRQAGKREGGQAAVRAEGESLQEALKYELSRAVGDTVDAFFKKFSATLLTQPAPVRVAQTPVNGNLGLKKSTKGPSSPELFRTEESVKSRALDYCEGAEAQSAEGQTEALSLVVRKPALSHPGSTGQGVKRPYPLHHAPFHFGYSAPFHENQILEHLLKYGPHGSFGSFSCLPPPMDRSSPDSVDLVSSIPAGHHSRQAALGPMMVDGLSLPHVKMECGDLPAMAERNPYMPLNIQEGLTPSHLKKAKLMFFYTRYPSSNVLKTFFPDVKFNRCITSQLIKWFSNFREFYYIQMEKFARQAIMDGVSDVKEMCVTRDSELFRALNMHYNKANDFQVPERFLEVAEITLHEFFNAISLSKDSDPSWKKAIYKVICKLDSEVPDEFKSSSCL
ncbi:prospero homeobox protein 2 [Scleropages formosus]|uniref:Prospero homeobox 2 n=1 Tax=Scleropages formosus TaxID=113540 RepID=A0A8C9SPF4_SCLFO|nr:prospero homeobox protein 2 [Scleropages formosus]XP_029114210.1 prospero homeobox protein 2 [Scleropages formosus]